MLLTLLLLLVHSAQGLWITLPSSQDGCGSFSSDSYFWDTNDFSGYNYNQPATLNEVVPKGDYYFYFNSKNGPFYYSDVRQYFCTMNVDSMPVGSYCFYQNPKNSNGCPDGFSEGTRTQDDEDTNCASGPKDTTTTLPKRENTYFTSGPFFGTIDTTKWFFCCGSGNPSNSISFDPIRSQLPDSFVLFRKGDSCQVINGRNSVQTGFVFWDDEDTNNGNSKSGALPDGVLNSDTTFYYCTYGPSFLPYPPTNLKLTQKNSTFTTISWKAVSGVYYKIYTSPSSTQKTKYASTSIILSSLSPSTTYTFYIYSGKNNPSGGAETYETVGASIQFTTCSTNYTGVNCDQPVCDPTCIVHGDCIAPNQCLCHNSWGGSACNQCTNGYYMNNGNCGTCSSCNHHGTCSDGPSGTGLCTCDTGYTTPNSTKPTQCSTCSDGFVMVDSNCIKCHETCETCKFNATYCTSCKAGLELQEDGTCTSECSDGSYYSGGCHECSSSCETCYGGNDNQCLSCPNGKVLESGSCVINCSDGHYPDGDNICQGCQYPCSTCFGPENGECLSCISPNIRNGTSCILENECTQNGFVDSNRDCQRCNSTCLTCYGPNGDQCLSCSNGGSLLNGECLNQCPISYYSNSTSNICQACNPRCSECFGGNENECISCDSPLLLSTTTCVSSLECSDFGYKNDSICSSCNEACSKCNGPNSTDCLECSGSKSLLNGECLDECPSGYFLSENQCQYCSFPCLNCTGEGANCSSCIESFSLNDTTCISDYECTLSGYIENGTCYGCNSNCSTCFGPTSNNCLSCSEPTYLMGEICLNSCPSSYYPANITQSCEKCNQSCLECSGGGTNDCLSCSNTLYLYSGKCLIECPTGYYQDSSSFHCNQCSHNCLTCASESTCTSCVPQYLLFDGKCITACPDGFTSNNATCSETSNQSQNKVGLGVGLTFGLLFLILLAILAFFLIKRQKKNQNNSREIMKSESKKHIIMNKINRFSSRKVSMDTVNTTDESGQPTLMNTQLNLSLPGFLRLNFGESLILGKVVGSGGAGDLYAAEVINQSLIDRFNEKYVVVKYVKDIPGQQEEKSLQYFHDEVAINWALNFESNIIKMIGYCDDPKCLVTKLYERDLFSLLHDPSQEIGIIRKCTLALHVSKGIQSIHQIKAAHRDIKSKNVLIERGITENEGDIRAVICDFGLTITSQTRIGRGSQLQTLNGLSAQYAAPEVFKNNEKLKQKNDQTPRFGINLSRFTTSTSIMDESISNELIQSSQKADVFAFGVVLWEIITRQIPWSSLTYNEIEQSIRAAKRLEMNQGIELSSNERILFQLAQSCWEEDPNQRPTITSIISKIDLCLAELTSKSSL